MEYSRLSGHEWVLEKVYERHNYIHRPPVANVDLVIIVCTAADPPISLQLLDRLLVLVEHNGLDAVICLNKDDLPHEKEESFLRSLYSGMYPVVVTSARLGHGIQELKAMLSGRISVFSGLSGVGKTSLINSVIPGLDLRTAAISDKSKRGRHTTRQVELMVLGDTGLVADTPGFSQLELSGIKSAELPEFFPEFRECAKLCRFTCCAHKDEPECAVKSAVEKGEIAGSRYHNYLTFLDEIKAAERSY